MSFSCIVVSIRPPPSLVLYSTTHREITANLHNHLSQQHADVKENNII